MSGLYAADGSWNVTVVPGTSWTGVYAADGSLNVIVRTTENGYYHPCGAVLVTVRSVAGVSIYTAYGHLNISASPYIYGSQPVTVVSGSLSGSGSYYPWIFV